MNDRHPQIRAWIQTIARFGGEVAGREMHALLDEGLYSGFDGRVGPGWLPLLNRLAADLVALGWDRDLHQVKEKFGTLRFYVGLSTEAIDARIAEAEAESARTCETCGGPGERSEDEERVGWRRCHRCPPGAGGGD